MRIFLLASLLLSLWLVPANMNVQPPDASQRAREIAALFNKSKHKVKEKRGIRIEINVDVTSEPVVKRDARDYAGTYEAFSDYPFKLEVAASGQITASGAEPDARGTRSFTLRDAKIEGALLTGTKVYADGGQEKFEGVFLNRTVRSNTTDNGDTTFGLGVVFDPPKASLDDSFSLTKLFYELKQ